MLRPNPSQLRLADLRSRAAAQGIMVRLESIDIAGKIDSYAVYSLPWSQVEKKLIPRSEWNLERQRFAHEGHFYQDWDWRGSTPALSSADESFLRELLSNCWPGIVALRLNRIAVSVIWNEARLSAENDDSLAKIHRFLVSLHDHFLPGKQASK